MKINNTGHSSLSLSGVGDGVLLLAADRKQDASIQAHKMKRGRDEMNLAEFPLTGLNSRSGKKGGSLVFEDSIPDRASGGTVKKLPNSAL